MSKRHTIELNDYQLANLKSMIEACGYWAGASEKYPEFELLEIPHPFQAFNSGDWIGELAWKLSELETDKKPNIEHKEYRKRAFEIARERWIHRPE
jgi:hypothetical protein